MVWRPTDEIRRDIQARRFVPDYESAQDYLTEPPHPADESQESYLVLDGQQRLQSLYLSFFGSFDGKRVHLKVDHVPSDSDGDTDYPSSSSARSKPGPAGHDPPLQDHRPRHRHEFPFILELANRLAATVEDPGERRTSSHVEVVHDRLQRGPRDRAVQREERPAVPGG